MNPPKCSDDDYINIAIATPRAISADALQILSRDTRELRGLCCENYFEAQRGGKQFPLSGDPEQPGYKLHLAHRVSKSKHTTLGHWSSRYILM